MTSPILHVVRFPLLLVVDIMKPIGSVLCRLDFYPIHRPEDEYPHTMRELGARWRTRDLVFRESSKLEASIHAQELVDNTSGNISARLPAISTCEGVNEVWGGARSARMSMSSKTGTTGQESSVRFKGRGQRR